jgi:alpha-amylase/alpha-mannosidase (GH57 family)
MKYKEFKELVDLMVKHEEKIDAAYKLKIDLIDFCDDQNKLINTLWGHILTVEGLDWFSWFMYEKDYISGKIKKHLTAKDESGKEICKDLKGLHEYLVTQMYFKN